MSASVPPPMMPALSTEQLRDLAEAKMRFKRIRRAIRVAYTDGATLGFCAVLTMLGAVFGMGGILIGLVLGALAGMELYGARELKALNPKAPIWLAMNQLLLAAALIVYAVYNLMFPAPLPAELTASAGDLKSMGYDLETLTRQVRWVLYGSLIVIAVVVQGSMAWFYYRRGKMVEMHVRETPEWIRQLQASGVDL